VSKQFVRIVTGAAAHHHERYADFPRPVTRGGQAAHSHVRCRSPVVGRRVIVLREIAMRLGLAETITVPLGDARDPARVRHTYAEMATARMVMIAAGYEDCDDVDALTHAKCLPPRSGE
jgi:hypothetical protein